MKTNSRLSYRIGFDILEDRTALGEVFGLTALAFTLQSLCNDLTPTSNLNLVQADVPLNQDKRQTIKPCDQLLIPDNKKSDRSSSSVQQNEVRTSGDSNNPLESQLNISFNLLDHFPENLQIESRDFDYKDMVKPNNASSLPLINPAVDTVQSELQTQKSTGLVVGNNDSENELPYTAFSSVVSPGGGNNPDGDPNGGQLPPIPQQPPTQPQQTWEVQDVLINGNNDHGAPMVIYHGQEYESGQPTGETIDLPGFVPVNNEYDYKTSGRIPAGDPQVIPIKWVATNAPEVITGEFIKWKMSYTPPQDGTQRIRFWDSSVRRIEFHANTDYEYTADPDAPSTPIPHLRGIFPSAVEGIETSKLLLDAGDAQLSIEYVQPYDFATGTQQPSIFVNYKPVKFTVTPVLKKLALGADSVQPQITSHQNLSNTWLVQEHSYTLILTQ